MFPYSEPLHLATESYGPDGRYGQYLTYLLVLIPGGELLASVVDPGAQLAAGAAVSGRWRCCGCRPGTGGAQPPGMWVMTILMAVLSLVFVAPCGLPLALGCRRLWRLGFRRAAWWAGIGLGAVTVRRRWWRDCSGRSRSPSTRPCSACRYGSPSGAGAPGLIHCGRVTRRAGAPLHNRSFLQSVRSVSQRVRIANAKGIEGRCSEAARTRLTQEFEKRFPGQAGVTDQCSQETPPKLPVSRYREPPAARPDQDHVTAFHAIERESDPGDRRDELVSRNDRKSRHRYTRTSTT